MVLGIYGTGGTGREVRDIVTAYPEFADRWERIIFIDDTKEVGTFDVYEVFPLKDAVANVGRENLEVCIAVGEPRVKQILLDKVRTERVSLTNIIHPDAFVAPDAELGESVILKKGTFVSSKARVGDNTCLQEYSAVGHDVEIGDNCQISCSVSIGGFTKIGNCTYIGMNSAIKDRITVGENVIISMGSVVQRDIPDGMIVMGNPARIIRKNETGKIFK